MGRHDGRDRTPARPWPARVASAALRWAGHLALGAFAGAVVLGATLWAGTPWGSARLMGASAAVVVAAAAALGRTLPGPPAPHAPGPEPAPRTPGTGRHDPA
ncbi:hypothetical protein [Cellulomonas sp. B6]|uniref:hypothetical protein n=1 Tax=Cellulomonas sp. B6 TaxID=1295626 RepID=UPI00073CFC6B|nr:hypothetical protein [Cellulomonas sp. B6]KSW19602.1 hypothetical protein ATM99_16340 [Cellulomonas sp. B6]